MKVTLYQDDTITLNLDLISKYINKLGPDINVIKGSIGISLKGLFIISPESYNMLPREIDQECKESNIVIIFTEKRYDNNYFYSSYGNKFIVSYSGWDQLTSLPRNNGAVYFICSIIARYLDFGPTHQKITGCINDFCWDKTGIDVGMKSACICFSCLTQFNKKGDVAKINLLSQVQKVLNDIGIASRTSLDICEYWKMKEPEDKFDVFLCHNGDDKDAIRDMNYSLKAKGIRTWFDEEQVPPGRLWQDILGEQVSHIKTAAIFVGQSGIGPWQHIEIIEFLEEFKRRRCPVIPVILSDCQIVPELPLFLKRFTWVDFRKDKPSPFDHLLWGITGIKPQ